MLNESDILLRSILQAEPTGLSRLLLDLDPASELGRYARVLLAYWRANMQDLDREATLQGSEVVGRLTELRIAIRKNTQCQNPPPSISELDQQKSLWSAELAFVSAMYFETLGKDVEALTYYLKARSFFEKHQAWKKAAKSLHNAVAAQSRITPSQRLIHEYQEAAHVARRAGDIPTVASALNNLSREFQLMGALRVALRFSNDAVDLLQEHAYGTYSFYLAVCHRAHLYMQLGQVQFAAADFEECSAAEFPEVQGSLTVLREWLEKAGCEILVSTKTSSQRIQTWAEREQAKLLPHSENLSDLENRLLSEVAEGPKSSHQLIASLWGDTADFFSLENRLKQVIHRLRRKNTGLIHFAEGRYHITANPSGRTGTKKERSS